MERRPLLASVGVALSTPLTGCLAKIETLDSGNRDDDGSHGGTPTDPGTHHLYLVNLDDESRRVTLEVVARDGDDPVIEGTYEIPDERGGEFREIAAWGESYEVTVALETGPSETFSWDIESCPGPTPEAGDAELPEGSRNGSVRVEPGADELSFITDTCDEIIVGTRVPTGPARQFEVEKAD